MSDENVQPIEQDDLRFEATTPDEPQSKPDTSSESEPEASDDVWTPEVLEIASDLGLTEKQARKFGTPEALAHHIDLTTRREREGRREPQPRREPGQQAEKKKEEPDEEPFPELAELSGEDYDEAIKAFTGKSKAAIERLAKDNKELKQAVKYLASRAQEATEEQYLRQFDEAISGLDDDRKAKLGEGLFSSDHESAEFRRITKIHEEIQLIQDVYQRRNGHKMPFKRAFSRAVTEVLGEAKKKEVDPPRSGRVEQTVIKPNGRAVQKKNLSPDEAAFSRVDAFFRDNEFGANGVGSIL
jgi:hypothetical protein